LGRALGRLASPVRHERGSRSISLTFLHEVLVDRRKFIAASAVAAVSPLPTLEAFASPAQQAPRQYIELRRYHLIPGPKMRAFVDFVGQAAVPAMNRAGVSKVGAFTMVYGQNAPTLLLVLAHDTIESVITLRDRLAADAEYGKTGAAILDAPLADPAFMRVESTLLRAFAAMPKVEAPASTSGPRIVELRTYESPSDRAALNKLAMFNAGEVPIFRRTGLTPVFFGETLVGEKMPSLNYMLTFTDMAARDAAWKSFSADPDWKKLSGDPQYKDNVSTISDVILRPTAYSQL
jgi:hypothetical protein